MGTMKFNVEMFSSGKCLYQHFPTTQLKFAKCGSVLFSSSSDILPSLSISPSPPLLNYFEYVLGKLNGVTTWDVETQKAIRVFNHHLTGDWEIVCTTFIRCLLHP